MRLNRPQLKGSNNLERKLNPTALHSVHQCRQLSRQDTPRLLHQSSRSRVYSLLENTNFTAPPGGWFVTSQGILHIPHRLRNVTK